MTQRPTPRTQSRRAPINQPTEPLPPLQYVCPSRSSIAVRCHHVNPLHSTSIQSIQSAFYCTYLPTYPPQVTSPSITNTPPVLSHHFLLPQLLYLSRAMPRWCDFVKPTDPPTPISFGFLSLIVRARSPAQLLYVLTASCPCSPCFTWVEVVRDWLTDGRARVLLVRGLVLL